MKGKESPWFALRCSLPSLAGAHSPLPQRPGLLVNTSKKIISILFSIMDKSKTSRKLKMYAMAVLSLFCGGCIYFLFRSESLLMFKWAESLQLKESILRIRLQFASFQAPDFFIYALPDGLWSLSYILFIEALWLGDKKSWIYASVVPAIGFLSEFFQLLGVIQGTFDKLDAIFYITPFIIFYGVKTLLFKGETQ